jgi:hypothetical protein
MGSDYVSVNVNNLNLRKAYDLLIGGRVVESSRMSFAKPKFSEVLDIEIGSDGTKKSAFMLKDGGFVSVSRTVDIDKVR